MHGKPRAESKMELYRLVEVRMRHGDVLALSVFCELCRTIEALLGIRGQRKQFKAQR